MTEDVLHLPPGAMVQLQLAAAGDQAPRYAVRVIGYLPGGSLVVTTPTAKGRVQIVREGQRFNVRMLRGNSVTGFVAQVLQSLLKPYPHLHLEYPREVARILVRNAQRVSAGLAAAARNTRLEDRPEHHRPVRLLDLSATGAKVSADAPLGEVGELLQLSFSIEVAGQAEQLAVLGEIRNHAHREGEEGIAPSHIYGIQFRSINRFQQVLMHGWVLERLAAEAAVVG